MQGFIFSFRPISLISVSYTHLDVYKRQKPAMTTKVTIRNNILLVCIAMLSLIGLEGYRLIKEYNTTKQAIETKIDKLLISTAKMYGQEKFLSGMSDRNNPSFIIQRIQESEIDTIPINFTSATLDTNLSEGLELLMITNAIKNDSNFLSTFAQLILEQEGAKDINELHLSIEGSEMCIRDSRHIYRHYSCDYH